MPSLLPAQPSLEHLKKESKAVLRAHEEGRAEVCTALRLLRQFHGKPDQEILAAPLQLQEVQHAVARQYGFKSWAELRHLVESCERRDTEERKKWQEQVPGQVRPESLVLFKLKNIEFPSNIPYLGAGVPAAMVQLLRFNEEDVDFADLVAACGWAFSFSYRYDGSPSAALRVGTFAYVPEQLGYDRNSVSCSDKGVLWDFVRRNVDREVPMVCTHVDGGLVYGYRNNSGAREIWFDSTVQMGWTDISEIHPMDTCDALVKKHSALSQEDTVRGGLSRAVAAASPHEEDGEPRGIAALEAYAADVEDPAKDFEGERRPLWFCWAGFERLSARTCAAEWLRRAAQILPEARSPLMSAADNYGAAFELYEAYRTESQSDAHSGTSLQERARTPERIAVIAPILRRAIDQERNGLDDMKKALTALH